MDPLQLLRRQHRDLKALFDTIAQIANPAARDRLLRRLAERLELHLRMEEEVLYPAVWDLGTRQARGAVAEAYEGHATLKVVLEELAEIDVPGNRFAARMAAFRHLVDDHVEGEETVIFALARQFGPGKLQDLGTEMIAKVEAALDRAA